jgi:arginase
MSNDTNKTGSWPAELYETTVDVIGIPYNFGQQKHGTQKGPQKIRAAGLIDNIREFGFKVHDKGDLKFEEFANDPTVNNIRRPKCVGAANRKIAESVSDSLKDGHVCVTLGGDHSLAIGSIYGHAQAEPDLGVIWIDAHADLNTPLTSPTGNVHGMPLSFLVHELKDYIPKGTPEFDWVQPWKNLSYIALRDLDEGEKQIIDDYGVKAYMMSDVTEQGIGKIVDLAIEAVSSGNPKRPIHLSFDIDALDPVAAPSTGTAVPGGLSLREGVYITEKIAATGRLQVMDLAEVNPELGSAADQLTTVQSACEIIEAWFGKRSRKFIRPGYSIPRP